ncbi:abc transporter [Chaetomium strumarium]|uniref:Abc transporter n=1 Tax=Chaetomium strumarium TaxID=1170767 RepID=A0AAJ0M365_9PEZI|nr:abc transporter [Chaetomium strumarium]
MALVSVIRLSRLLHVASTISVLFFVFVSFLFHYGKTNYDACAILRKNVLRTAVVGLIAGAYGAESVLVALRGDGLGINQEHSVAAAYYAVAWTAVCLGRRLVVAELFGLATLSLLSGVPSLTIEAAAGGRSKEETALLTLPFIRLLLVVCSFADCLSRFAWRKQKNGIVEEETPFLSDSTDSQSYGTDRLSVGTDSTSDSSGDGQDDAEDDDDDDDDDGQDVRTTQLRRSGSWTVYLKHFKIFLPYLIPRNDVKVQACLFASLLCLIGNRILNILVPAQLGRITDKLLTRQLPYADLAFYLLLTLLHDSSGLGMIQALAKIPVEQFSYRRLTNAAFAHVMSLAMEFHADRDSAEVMKAVEQGGALTRVLETAVLEMLPTVVDMAVAFVLLYAKFNSAVALCMLTASLAFFAVEVVTSSWNVDNRRRVTGAERREARVMHQAVQGWVTVSAFNMFAHERLRFGRAVDKHLAAKRDWSQWDAYITALSEGLIPVTFFALACLVANEVHAGRASPGDFVFLIQYWDFLIWPIRLLSHEYRYLMSDLIDAERLLDLLSTEPTVADKEGAPPLGSVEGRVEFDHVEFAYGDKRQAIRDVSILARPGETVALVGTTGAGKSTLVKLLLRYYDVNGGSVRIDGQDVRDVTQGSLRDAIGVVPQDPLLFNASIMENLRYGRLSASDEEVYEACRAAAIHDKILSFAQGYATKVGEQGVKLSGGEVQRLAIARVFLKDPPILVLDEATSAVDTGTEAEIQAALRRVSRKRTTFVVAHRLSTVVRADQILVLEDGVIVERGRHQELLDKRGRYAALWRKQLGGTDEDPLLDA